MRCRKIRYWLLAVCLLCPIISHAQQIVIDPSQIAASATNAAEQVDYMLDQLGELAHLGEQMNTVRDHFDNVFGEDGIGGKAISVMEDLGTLTRLTQAYNSTMESTERYARMMQQMGQLKLSDANMLLHYMLSMKDNIEMGVETARKILSTLGFSKKEKKDELEKIIDEMEQNLKTLDKAVRIEAEATIIAEGLSEFVDYIDSEMTADKFVEAMEPYGDLEQASEGTLGILSMILGIFSILSAFTAFLIKVRGGIAGDPTAEHAFLRVAVGMFIGMVMLNVLSSMFGIRL